MARPHPARVVISWSATAHAYLARDPAQPGILARGATLAEAARNLAAAVEPQTDQPLLAVVDAIQREVLRRRTHVSRKEIAAETRAARVERQGRG
jgi:hypothetical protein